MDNFIYLAYSRGNPTTPERKHVAPKSKPSTAKSAAKSGANSLRFESAKIESLYPVLDGIAWMDSPSSSAIAQFAGIDPRTAGKLLKNAVQIGLVDEISSRTYSLALPYPYEGSPEQKAAVVREALVRYPLLVNLRQFVKLGDSVQTALRKAATMAGIEPFKSEHFAPLLTWAQKLGALRPDIIVEDVVDAAAEEKEVRHRTNEHKRVAFLSHSSNDKPFIRQLAADLKANGIEVWLDEQRIRVGDSIPEMIAQGLASSDYFLIAISRASTASEWVKKELNNALVAEVQRRHVHILPVKLDDSQMPSIISDKKYADFSKSYKRGLEELLDAMRKES